MIDIIVVFILGLAVGWLFFKYWNDSDDTGWFDK